MLKSINSIFEADRSENGLFRGASLHREGDEHHMFQHEDHALGRI